MTEIPVDASPAAKRAPAGRAAGIDYGSVRIGVAISDPGRSLASPLCTYTRRGEALDAVWFRKLAAEEEIALFVVGLPVHLSGAESQKSQEVRAFAAWLVATTRVPVEFFDERFTTSEAQRLMLLADLSRKQRKDRKDKLAAQIILAAYLEARATGSETPICGLDD